MADPLSSSSSAAERTPGERSNLQIFLTEYATLKAWDDSSSAFSDKSSPMTRLGDLGLAVICFLLMCWHAINRARLQLCSRLQGKHQGRSVVSFFAMRLVSLTTGFAKGILLHSASTCY